MNELEYHPVPFRALDLELYVPDPKQVKMAYESGQCSEFPFWSQVWPSAIALATTIQNEPKRFEGKRILEIGAGIGLPAFVSCPYASSVIVSDYIPEAIQWMNFNISRLKLTNIHAELVDWRVKHLPNAEIVLLSDVGYDESAFEAVTAMVKDFISKGSQILISVPFRMISARFIELFEDQILEKQIIEVSGTHVLVLRMAFIDSL